MGFQYLVVASFDSKHIAYLDMDCLEQGWNLLTEMPQMR